MSERVNRFLGDSPVRVLLKLLLASFVVGMVMHAFGWSPFGKCRHVVGVTAADDAADRNAALAEEAEHGPVAQPQSLVRQRQLAELVVAVRIDACIVEDEVRLRIIQQHR